MTPAPDLYPIWTIMPRRPWRAYDAEAGDVLRDRDGHARTFHTPQQAAAACATETAKRRRNDPGQRGRIHRAS